MATDSLHNQPFTIGPAQRAALKCQDARVIWFTGLSGAGKSTIANELDKRLYALGKHCMVLDGDNVRQGLNKDLGFTDRDRSENIRRIAEVSRLMLDAGLIVLVAFISPFREDRAMARALLPPGAFVEVFIDAPLVLVEQRDPKGLYRRARQGEILNFTGIDSPYEAPLAPDVHVLAGTATIDQAVVQILRRMGLAAQ